MAEYRKEMVSPDGRTVISHSAVETNNLMYGQGYREADTSTGKKATKSKAADKGQAEDGS